MEYNNQDVRRQDRLLDETRAFEILRDGEYGILSMQSEDGNGAYGIPINYVWDRGNSIYIHCAPVGRKLRCIDACPNVSFCVTGRSRVIPDKLTTGYTRRNGCRPSPSCSPNIVPTTKYRASSMPTNRSLVRKSSGWTSRR